MGCCTAGSPQSSARTSRASRSGLGRWRQRPSSCSSAARERARMSRASASASAPGWARCRLQQEVEQRRGAALRVPRGPRRAAVRERQEPSGLEGSRILGDDMGLLVARGLVDSDVVALPHRHADGELRDARSGRERERGTRPRAGERHPSALRKTRNRSSWIRSSAGAKAKANDRPAHRRGHRAPAPPEAPWCMRPNRSRSSPTRAPAACCRTSRRPTPATRRG